MKNLLSALVASFSIFLIAAGVFMIFTPAKAAIDPAQIHLVVATAIATDPSGEPFDVLVVGLYPSQAACAHDVVTKIEKIEHGARIPVGVTIRLSCTDTTTDTSVHTDVHGQKAEGVAT